MQIPTRANKRKAISPVLATVILIAITLIAAIAIAGFVFGLFGTFTKTATVSGQSITMTAAVANHAAVAAACTNVNPAAGSYLAFSNTGSASATINSIAFTFGGSTFVQSMPAACTVVAGTTEYVTETGLGGSGATAGATFTAAASMSNGASVLVSGQFS